MADKTLTETLVKIFAWVTAAAVAYFMLVLILVNLAMGCGEVIYFADGHWETGACWLIPYETQIGEWK